MPRDTDDEPIRRHSKRHNPWLIPSRVGGVALVLVGLRSVGMVVLFSGRGSSGGSNLPVALGGNPSAEQDKSWTAKQLAEHLKSKGVFREWELSSPADAPKISFQKQPAVLFKDSNGDGGTITEYGGVLECERQAARDTSGTNDSFLTWGRFRISGGRANSDKLERGVVSHLNGAKYWAANSRGEPAEKHFGSK